MIEKVLKIMDVKEISRCRNMASAVAAILRS